MCHAQFLLYIFCRLKLHNCKLLMKLFLPNFSVYAAHMTIFLYHTQSHVAWQFCNKLVEFFAATFGTITYYYYFFFLMKADLQLHMCAQCSIFFSQHCNLKRIISWKRICEILFCWLKICAINMLRRRKTKKALNTSWFAL